jgi:hypothetical protein
MKNKRPTRKLARLSNNVFVELMTPKGKVFSGCAAAVRFSPANVVVELEPGAVSYFGLINFGELALRIGSEFHFFALLRATASIVERRLIVLAESITSITAPFENCGNPTCDCADVILDHPNAIPVSSVSPIFRPRGERQPKLSSKVSAPAKRKKKKQ